MINILKQNAKEQIDANKNSKSDDIYKVTRAIGSYKDQPEAAMSVTIGNGDNNYTKETCFNACKDYKFFGLQDVDENGKSKCFCSNNLEQSMKYGHDVCGTGGGRFCNYIYQNLLMDDTSVSQTEDLETITLELNKLIDRYYIMNEENIHMTMMNKYMGKKMTNFYVANFDNDAYYTKSVKTFSTSDTMHLGKIYYAEKDSGTDKFDIYEYPISKIDFTGQSNKEPIQFYEINNFDSPGNDIVKKMFSEISSAKEFCVELKAVGFVYDKTTKMAYFKKTIFPQTKKIVDNAMKIYMVIPSIVDNIPCNKKVDVVSPSFIKMNCVLKNGPPPATTCDRLPPHKENINTQLYMLATKMARKLQKALNSEKLYSKMGTEKRQKYYAALSEYDKVFKTLNRRENSITSEIAISNDSFKKVQMHKIFITIVLAIVFIIAYFIIFGFSRFSLMIASVFIFIFLYIIIVRAQNT